jgi:hypothetical protein
MPESLYPLPSHLIYQEEKGATMQKANGSHGKQKMERKL